MRALFETSGGCLAIWCDVASSTVGVVEHRACCCFCALGLDLFAVFRGQRTVRGYSIAYVVNLASERLVHLQTSKVRSDEAPRYEYSRVFVWVDMVGKLAFFMVKSYARKSTTCLKQGSINQTFRFHHF